MRKEHSMPDVRAICRECNRLLLALQEDAAKVPPPPPKPAPAAKVSP